VPYKDKSVKRARDAAAYAADREAGKKRNKDWREANPEKYEEQLKKRRAKAVDREKEKIRHAEYRAANKEKIRLSNKKYRELNPHKIVAQGLVRRNIKKQATPSWANQNKIKLIYRDAREFRAHGLDVHVDHIIPLKAKLACGLHNEFNLTIKLAHWNDSKGNKLDV